MNNRRIRRVLFACLIPFASLRAQQSYQTPSPDLVRILEAPANPVATISPDRHWVLVTVSDPRTVTISEMADSAYYLAGTKIRANPDFRIENIGIRSAIVSGVDGKTQRTLDVPANGRIGSTAWSRDGAQLAYTTISNGKMALDILDPVSGRTRRISAPAGGARIRA